MLYPSAELQNIGMLYNPTWNGFVEGPTWGAWWVQNSYGPTYCGLPFFTEPYCTYVANSQDLWFSQMGDGKHASFKGWVGPDGCLCDAAAPGVIIFKQGDGRVDIHDWGMEFTAAGLLLQAEQLLISRDQKAIAHYLPMLRRCADFIETRRDLISDNTTGCSVYDFDAGAGTPTKKSSTIKINASLDTHSIPIFTD